MFRFIKNLLVLILLMVLVAAGGAYYYIDAIIKHGIEKYGSEITGVAVTVGDVKLGLPDGKFEVTNLKIANPHGFTNPTLFEASNISVSMNVKSIFEDVIRIGEIKIDSPAFVYENNGESDNIKVLTANIDKSSKSNEPTQASNSETKPQKKVTIDHFYLNKSKVTANLGNVINKSLNLPDIYLSGIGKDQNGITIADAAEQIFREVSKFVYSLDVKSLVTDTVNAVKDSAKDIKNAVKSGDIEGLQKGINKILGN